jgi:hypothetical protein
MSEKWLLCRISKGMFSDETAVTYSPPGSRKTSVFVPSKFVKMDTGDIGRVKVLVFTKGGQTWAILPNENREEVLVRADDIS